MWHERRRERAAISLKRNNFIDDALFAAMEADGVTPAALSNDAEFLRRVTLDLTGRIPLNEAVGYWIAQFAGGIVGALVLWGGFSASPFYHRKITGLGADGYGKQSMINIGVGGAFIFEMILTALFVFIVLRVTSATANAATAAIAIGLTLTVVHMIGIPITGTSVNPARSLGPALIVGGAALSQVWLFIVAPLIGGVLAAGLHRLLYREESIRLAAEAQQPDETGAARTIEMIRRSRRPSW